LKVVLETAGYRVIEALHVPEGMRASSRLFPKPDLAVVVAGLGGGVWASLDLLRSALDQAPLLVMSPEEVGCMLDSLEGRGRERADHPSQWLARVHRVLHEGECESALSLNLV